MVGGDPALVVALVGAGGDGLAAGQRAGRGLLIAARLATLALRRGPAAAAALAGLREERLDVGLVYEVDGASEEAREEQVQEDTGWRGEARLLLATMN